jgi:hypothetical protein
MELLGIDQCGVVWFSGGFMSSAAYESMRRRHSSLPPIAELPELDNRDQNVVDVSEED